MAQVTLAKEGASNHNVVQDWPQAQARPEGQSHVARLLVGKVEMETVARADATGFRNFPKPRPTVSSCLFPQTFSCFFTVETMP